MCLPIVAKPTLLSGNRLHLSNKVNVAIVVNFCLVGKRWLFFPMMKNHQKSRPS